MVDESLHMGLPLIDGREKVTGALKYGGDVSLPGTLQARFVLSLHSHARIRHIDASSALAVPGVVAVLTSADMPILPPNERPNLLLAREYTVFVGQPVALVLAETDAAAQDGVEAVMVDYDVLPAAVTIDAALADDAPLVWGDNLPDDFQSFMRTKNHQTGKVIQHGNVEQGFAESDVILEHTYDTAMVHQSSVETHSILAQPDLWQRGVTVWSSTQDPFGTRQTIATMMNVPETNVRVVATAIGGGFGGKFVIYEPLVALAAVHAKRPVKLVLTRNEELLATNPAPAIRVHARLGAKRDGTLMALEAAVFVDDGCLPGWLGNFAAWQLSNLYRIPHMKITPTTVVTCKPSSGSYRAPTAPTAVFALDTLVDELAETLGLDPFVVKQRHLLVPGDLPVNGKPLLGSGAQEVLDVLEQHPLWRNREQIRETTGHGVGMAISAWQAGAQPGTAMCNLQRDGKLVINIGIADVSGVSTSFALLAAETFGVAPEEVLVVRSDTASSPWSGMSAGSMSLYNTGGAVVGAAKAARQQVLEIAANEFEAAIEDIEIVSGKVQVRGVPDKAIPLAQLAEKTMRGGSLHAPVSAVGRFAVESGEPAYSGQIAEVEVDEATGIVRVVRLVVVQDAGRAINPPMVRGQMAGGALQGIGWALYEALLYNEDGQLLTGSWMDYAMPSSTQAPPVLETCIVEAPSKNGPMGARGVGEAPVIATAAAVANAIAHAADVRMTELPMTPLRVWKALQAKSVPVA